MIVKKQNQVNKERLTFFSDALLAIIMTILVLDIKVPVLQYTTDSMLFSELLKELPHFVGFVISFSIITMLWITHHQFMQRITQPNMTLARINFGFICATAVIPFSTAFTAEYPSSPLAACPVASNFFVISFFLTVMIVYAVKAGLASDDIFPAYYNDARKKRGFIGMFVLAASALIAFVSPMVSHILLVFVPILHSIPVRTPNIVVGRPAENIINTAFEEVNSSEE
jgi:uncharacterized membrane protein